MLVTFSAAISSRTLHAQPPPSIAEAMLGLSNGNGASELEVFIPGFIKEISPENRRLLEAIEISWSEEQTFGSRILANYEKQLKSAGTPLVRPLIVRPLIVRHGPDVEYLKKLTDVIQPQMQQAKRYQNLRIGIVTSEKPDALSIPGGNLLFTSGLLATAESEAALIGVIGHELSHLDRGHLLLPLKQNKLLARPQNLNAMMNAFAVVKPFHPEFESEADADAFAWSIAAGYDPRELAHLLDNWDKRQNTQTPWLDAIPSFVKSHPDAGKRALALLSRFDALPQQPPLYIGRENLQRRLPRDVKRF